jgi:FkbM family methyltransferase
MPFLNLSRLLSNPLVRGVKERIRPGIRRLGVDVIAYDPSISAIARRMRLLRHHQIQVVFDIGANEGQYAASLREAGFEGLIVSFEPLAEVFVRLQLRASHDPRWKCLNLAVAHTSGTLRFNVDGSDGQCSSFLKMVPWFEKDLEPPHRHQSVRDVDAITLDEAIARFLPVASRLFVKMDVQGFEGRIIGAATSSLECVTGLQLELSLLPLYEGEVLLPDMASRLATRGFAFESIELGKTDAVSGRLLQADCLFFRS